MKSWFGQYFLHGNDSIEATVLLLDKKITIGYIDSVGIPVSLSWNISDIDSTFRYAEQCSVLVNRQQMGGRVEIPGREPSELINAIQAEEQKPWHKRSKAAEWRKYGLILTGFLTVLTVTWFLLVPWLSEKMASTVSIQTEEQLGDAAYEALSPSLMEDQHASGIVNEFFQALKISTPYNIRITVVRGPEINAFALPGGRIVVYSALLNRLESYPELAALLSHEFIHVNNRHSTKSIFRKLGSRIFLRLLFGKIGSVANVVAEQADNLKSLTYSRSLEKEADLQGLALLEERKIDPAGFVLLFETLQKASETNPDLPEFLGSHPDINNRIDYVREASKQASIAEHIDLETIFAKLKNKN